MRRGQRNLLAWMCLLGLGALNGCNPAVTEKEKKPAAATAPAEEIAPPAAPSAEAKKPDVATTTAAPVASRADTPAPRCGREAGGSGRSCRGQDAPRAS